MIRYIQCRNGLVDFAADCSWSILPIFFCSIVPFCQCTLWSLLSFFSVDHSFHGHPSLFLFLSYFQLWTTDCLFHLRSPIFRLEGDLTDYTAYLSDSSRIQPLSPRGSCFPIVNANFQSLLQAIIEIGRFMPDEKTHYNHSHQPSLRWAVLAFLMARCKNLGFENFLRCA